MSAIMAAYDMEEGLTELRVRGKTSATAGSPKASRDETVLARFGKRQQLRVSLQCVCTDTT